MENLLPVLILVVRTSLCRLHRQGRPRDSIRDMTRLSRGTGLINRTRTIDLSMISSKDLISISLISRMARDKAMDRIRDIRVRDIIKMGTSKVRDINKTRDTNKTKGINRTRTIDQTRSTNRIRAISRIKATSMVRVRGTDRMKVTERTEDIKMMDIDGMNIDEMMIIVKVNKMKGMDRIKDMDRTSMVATLVTSL